MKEILDGGRSFLFGFERLGWPTYREGNAWGENPAGSLLLEKRRILYGAFSYFT